MNQFAVQNKDDNVVCFRRNGLLFDPCDSDDILRRLTSYEEDEKAGLLLHLPCPLGGELWRVCVTPPSAVYAGNIYVKKIVFSRSNFWRIVMEGEFGKTVFLTHEEAEQVAGQLRKERDA